MKTVNRNYNMQDSDLNVFAANLVTNMNRDAAEFLLRGVNAAAITALSDLQQEFEMFPTDSYYQADISIAVESKNSNRAEAEKSIRAIVNCARIKWGEGSPQTKKFGASNMTRENDKIFLTTCRQVSTTAADYLTALTPVGLTQDMIDDLDTLADNFSSDLLNILDATEIRDTKTQERIAKGNELYELVSRYCEIGKVIWEDIDESKFNDYVIYGSSNPSIPSAPQNLIFNYGSRVLWWDQVSVADSYQLQMLSGTEYVTIYEGSSDNYPFTPPDGLSKFRVRASNGDVYGPFSEILEQYYYTVLPKVQNININQTFPNPADCELSWDSIPTVISYKIYQSVDNLGEYPAHWLYIGMVTETSKPCTLTLGKKNSFKIEASNTYQTSMSDPVSVDA